MVRLGFGRIIAIGTSGRDWPIQERRDTSGRERCRSRLLRTTLCCAVAQEHGHRLGVFFYFWLSVECCNSRRSAESTRLMTSGTRGILLSFLPSGSASIHFCAVDLSDNLSALPRRNGARRPCVSFSDTSCSPVSCCPRSFARNRWIADR